MTDLIEALEAAIRAAEDGERVIPKGADKPLPPLPLRVTYSPAERAAIAALWNAEMAGTGYEGILDAETIE